MSTTLDREPELRHPGIPTTPARGHLQTVLLACGIAYGLSFVIVNDLVAGVLYDGYSYTDQAISELSAKGASTRTLLVAMLPVWTALLVGFGLGVRGAAAGNRSLRLAGTVLVAHGIVALLWLPFPMTAREDMVAGTTAANDIGHIALTAVTGVFVLAELWFGGRALGGRFGLFSIVTAAAIVVFAALTGMQSGKVPEGEPTPWMGLFERLSIWAWLVWMAALAVILLRAGPGPRDELTHHAARERSR
jgi:hypothetical protein